MGPYAKKTAIFGFYSPQLRGACVSEICTGGRRGGGERPPARRWRTFTFCNLLANHAAICLNCMRNIRSVCITDKPTRNFWHFYNGSQSMSTNHTWRLSAPTWWLLNQAIICPFFLIGWKQLGSGGSGRFCLCQLGIENTKPSPKRNKNDPIIKTKIRSRISLLSDSDRSEISFWFSNIGFLTKTWPKQKKPRSIVSIVSPAFCHQYRNLGLYTCG